MADAAVMSGMPVQAKTEAMPMRRIIGFFFMVVGMFMAILDIQVVSSSLSEIQAGLSAGSDEIAWVQTAYLIAEVIMIPLSGMLARILSTRVLFTIAAAGFTVASALCATATSIDQMIVYRALQGFIGGGMIPSVFAAAFTIFPPSKRAIVTPIIGLTATLAPTIGPTVGGWLTASLSWHWLFLINVGPGVIVAAVAWLLVDFDKPELALMRKFDWWGLAGLAGFLGSLEYVLEEGPRKDWFGEPSIAIAGWLSLVAFVLFLERAFFSANPVVTLRPFRKPVFVFACVFNLVIVVGMYGAIYLLPVYLARVRGYDSLQIGTTVFVVGVAQLFSTVIAASLSQRIDMRWMISVGLVLFATSLWLSSEMTSEWGFWELALPQAVRGLALMLCIVPSVTMALASFPPEQLNAASGLFNLMRNLGGAVGIAVVNTWLQDNTRIAAARLGDALGHRGTNAGEVLTALTAKISAVTPDPTEASLAARAAFARVVGREALTLAFDDVFRVLAWIFFAALILVPFCRMPARTGAPPEAAVH